MDQNIKLYPISGYNYYVSTKNKMKSMPPPRFDIVPTFDDTMFLTSSSVAECVPARSGLLLLIARTCSSFELTAAADVRP
jgi:hypothetical protein